MKGLIKWAIFLAISFLIGVEGLSESLADHDEHHDKKRERIHRNYDDHDRHGHKGSDHERDFLIPVENETYQENCGACHFSYQPELLPSSSWKKVLAGLNDHYGNEIDLDEESRKNIQDYLMSNCADGSSAKRSVKIMHSLHGQSPMRITDVPYIREKHHEISASVFSRKSIGSFSNCMACHKTASQGIYDDDNVVIPK
jgi:cytochrome c551/c552